MAKERSFLRDTRHLWILFLLIAVAGAGAVAARNRAVPETWGQFGAYRGAALAEIASHPMKLQADHVCLKCHTDVGEERAESVHKAVGCVHCHGPGRKHVAEAEAGGELTSAGEWDGDFRTAIDLYITHNRKACLVCHESVIGMPEDFRKINVAEHLEEQGAEEIKSPNVCFECHEGHSPL
ncbi:MAG: hypothetical protein ACI8P0_005170 [Planctomycetaceae bacterium]|jgi:hypothetical protein